MAYRPDTDLEFLASCDDKDLDDLVYVLTHDSDGSTRLTEELTVNDNYKKYYPQHSKYWQNIAAEIQCFGANTLATLFRFGKGVEYREVLSDVYKHVTNKNANSSDSVKKIENDLLMFIFQKAIQEMEENELIDLAKELKFDSSKVLTGSSLVAAAQTIFKLGGFRSYQLTLIIVNSISRALFSRGLTLAANAGLMRIAGVLTGPIGLAFTGIWSAIDIAGPAYRVTIPATIQIALLRKKEDLSKEELIKAIEKEFDIDNLN